MQQKVPTSLYSVTLEPTKLILVGTRTTYSATGEAGHIYTYKIHRSIYTPERVDIYIHISGRSPANTQHLCLVLSWMSLRNPHAPALPAGRSTSRVHRPGRHCSHQAKEGGTYSIVVVELCGWSRPSRIGLHPSAHVFFWGGGGKYLGTSGRFFFISTVG